MRREGHIFVKESTDPVGQSSIDVLVPAYTSRQSKERRIGEIVTIEVGMLAEALRTASPKDVRLVSTSGVQTDVRVPLPHPLAALTLKLSYRSDVMHLLSHISGGGDIFVTSDGDFLRASELLKRKLGAIVMSADEAVEMLCREHGWPSRLEDA